MHQSSIDIRMRELESLGENVRIKAEALLKKLELNNPWRKINILILVAPMAQPRPRFKPLFKAGKFFRVHVYDPPNSSEWKENFGIRVGRILPSNFPVIGPVELNTLVYKKIPDNYSSAYRYLAEAGLIRPEKKPDADNYIKSIKDALSKIAWSDDSQVVLGECEKFYSAVPRVEFTMRYKERPMDKISLKKGKKEANDE